MTQLRKPQQDSFKNKDPAHILIAQGPLVLSSVTSSYFHVPPLSF